MPVMLKSAEFWVLVSFLAFMALLWKMKVHSTIAKALDDRSEAIRKELDEARRLRQDAQDLLAEYQQKQRQAETEAKSIIEQAQREADALKVASERALKEQLDRRARLAEDKIARAEAQAVAEVRAAAVERAVAATERILAQKTAGDVGGALVDQAIRDLKGHLN
jgi:F-type H+-transporting ATPase subunit b